MSLVQALTPINLQEEKQKFFDSNCKYNPQFKYKTLATLNKIYKYGKPKDEYLNLAKELLEKAFFNRTIKEIRSLEGENISKQKAQTMFNEFANANQLNNTIKLKCSEKFLGKASFYKNTLKLRMPLWHKEKEFLGTLYHEIGTHALRRINYLQQPFFLKKKQFEFKEYLYTEEGLASLHTLLARNFKIDYTGALNYVLCQEAQKKSFVEIFSLANQYLLDKERSWYYAVRHKRGLYNTEEGGGFTKDLIYFEGLIQVWQFLKNSNFDIEGLYLGKIAYEDIAKAREMNPDFIPLLPSFYSKNKNKYIEEIQEIAKINLSAS